MQNLNRLNLRRIRFTNRADVIDQGITIFNPKNSIVKTLKGRDSLIGTSSLNGDFGFGVLGGVRAKDFGSLATSTEFVANFKLRTQGINNKGRIETNRGRDVVKGTASANLFVATGTVAEAIAVVKSVDTSVITEVLASLGIEANVIGINNSKATIRTGGGNDAVDGQTEGSIAASATASVDASAIVEAIADAPLSDELIAFANAISTSLTTASISATGIKNRKGLLATGKGKDAISAIAKTSSSTFAGTSSSAFASASPNSQALAIAVAEAVAEASDIAIAIDNTGGKITTGNGADTIIATAEATGKAFGIINTGGVISTGQGADQIIVQATGEEAYGLYGGRVSLGAGKDSLTGTFGGGVVVNAGRGNDFIDGSAGDFGNATLRGGRGQDTLSLASRLADFSDISIGANTQVTFNLDGMTLVTTGFEEYILAGETYTLAGLASNLP
ncbi:hypothetical protein HRE53_16540 [Acaryochloris sp. 'Moss Beach']|uniref:hypothetical protein n=1 Tax=Acaryochloris sp. 'Moss Beach' TaxID=2740837 RepID=UPI001F454C94|nr:hypothetical protein [Acaryochloris sp. 'Moss Beach']UJB68188.1 hypothetical protein HRE53_16540 [Acaryochloris sp. 'Moss Beach']